MYGLNNSKDRKHKSLPKYYSSTETTDSVYCTGKDVM